MGQEYECGCCVAEFDEGWRWLACPLHAAAPALLAACKAIIEAMDGYTAQDRAEFASKAADVARTAIAQATGPA